MTPCLWFSTLGRSLCLNLKSREVPKDCLLISGDNTVLLKVGNHWHNNTASRPRKTNPQKTPLWKTQGSAYLLCFYSVSGYRFTLDAFWSPHSYYFPVNHEQTGRTGSRSGRPVTICTCIWLLVRTSAETTAVLTDVIIGFVSPSTHRSRPVFLKLLFSRGIHKIIVDIPKNSPLWKRLYKVVQIWPGQTVTCLHTMFITFLRYLKYLWIYSSIFRGTNNDVPSNPRVSWNTEKHRPRITPRLDDKHLL